KATTRGDMGRVMSTIMTRYKGRVDGKLLSSKVKQRLL
ncbi:MAG: GatB/YqeY domain-containing protein, partial [Desulfovibrio sp.]|nr:GatB/YqeY domain-containing protein [Desulfovibrio sp.]